MLNIFCDLDWDIVAKLFPGFATIIAVIIVYLLTKRNMKHETQERLSRYRKEKLYEAGMGFWSLLAFPSEAENEHSILYWTKEKSTEEKTYSLHVGNAKEFIKKLNEINYEKGYGLFLRIESRELFYEYRSILYGFLLVEKNNTSEKIGIQKKDMAEKLYQLHQQMVIRLKQEMQLEYPSL